MYKNIYVLVDMRRFAISNSTLDEAFALAKFTGAKLKVKHFIKLEEEVPNSVMDGGKHFMNLEKNIRWFTDGVLDRELKNNVSTEVEVEKVLNKDVINIILDDLHHWNADLIVMGCCHKLGSILHLLGDNFVEKLSNKTKLPILLVHTINNDE